MTNEEKDLARVVEQPLSATAEPPQHATGQSVETLSESSIREFDVYRFVYNEHTRAKMFEPHHCFDGQLVYRSGVLADTYWGFDVRGDTGRRFTPAEARAKGTLTFVCNLNDIEPIQEYVYEQYDEADRFNLCHQHGCYKKFAIRRGATKSRVRQLAILDQRVKDAKREAASAMERAFHCIERCQEQRRKLEAGEDVYI